MLIHSFFKTIAMALYVFFLVVVCAGLIGVIVDWRKRQKQDVVTIEEYRSLNKHYLSAIITIFLFCVNLFVGKIIGG